MLDVSYMYPVAGFMLGLGGQKPNTEWCSLRHSRLVVETTTQHGACLIVHAAHAAMPLQAFTQ